MNQESKEYRNPKVDKIIVTLAMLFLFAGVLAFYLLSGSATLIRLAGLFGGIVIALALAFFSESGRTFLRFCRDSWREVQKVVWPTRKEAVQMTGIVFVFVLIVALFLWFSDKALEYVLYDLILGWRR